MNIGMEQLVWAIILVIFIIITVLKSRARKKTLTTTEKPMEVKKKVEERQDRLGRYLENILGVERPEPEPQRITIEEEKPRPLKEIVKPITRPEKKEVVGKFESPLMKVLREREKAVIPEKKELYRAKFPWGTISREDLPSAIIFAEIIGPPISKRKSHRLF
jgi:hypothetical protein